MSGLGAVTFMSYCFPPGGGINPMVTPVQGQLPSGCIYPSEPPMDMATALPAVVPGQAPSCCISPSELAPHEHV